MALTLCEALGEREEGVAYGLTPGIYITAVKNMQVAVD